MGMPRAIGLDFLNKYFVKLVNWKKIGVWLVKQEAQLSQRDRATLLVIEYFDKSLKAMTLLRPCVSPY